MFIPTILIFRFVQNSEANLTSNSSSQLYEFIEFVGEVGGYVGFVMGLSILDLVLWLTGMIDQKINIMRKSRPEVK